MHKMLNIQNTILVELSIIHKVRINSQNKSNNAEKKCVCKFSGIHHMMLHINQSDVIINFKQKNSTLQDVG